jgi:hypothetical protein
MLGSLEMLSLKAEGLIKRKKKGFLNKGSIPLLLRFYGIQNIAKAKP